MKRRLFGKLKNNGFTLMEMLIVVAIIAILVAVAVPIFSSESRRAGEASDNANVRAAYGEAVTTELLTGKETVRWVPEPMKANYDGVFNIENMKIADDQKWSKGDYVKVTVDTDGKGTLTISNTLGSDVN